MTESRASVLEGLLKHDRMVVIGGLALVVALAWAYTLAGVGMHVSAFEMTAAGESAAGTDMGAIAMTAMQPVPWDATRALVMVVMWWVMMVAMMLPSAAPMILLFATVNRKSREHGAPFIPTGVFAAGYLAAWGGFSVLATGLQWSLERALVISPMMATTSVAVGGAVLIAAGVYQLTPLKHACLRHCRSPFQFVMLHWRPGTLGAFQMGLEHGVFCLGCCWVLMALLFYGGVMNLYWIIGLALVVLVEKMVPAGHRLAYLGGAVLVAWGGALVAVSL